MSADSSGVLNHQNGNGKTQDLVRVIQNAIRVQQRTEYSIG